MNRLVCPRCGALIQLDPSAIEAKVESDVDVNEVLKIFRPKDRKDLDVRVDGNTARITLKGKYSSAKFKRVMTEVRGYGGQWVKGYFRLPIAGLIGDL